MTQNKYTWSFVGALVLTSLLLGCESTLEPFAQETGQFSIYGALTLTKKQHFIRIKDLNDPVLEGSTKTLDATVTLEHLQSGPAETLADSIVVFNGIATHNFRTRQDIRPGATYRLTVERPDGRASQAEATMPLRTKVEVQPSEADTADCDQAIRLTFQNVPEPSLLRLSVGAFWSGRWRWVEKDIPTQYGILPWRLVKQLLPESALRTVVDREEYCTLLHEDKIRLVYTHFGPDWPADSVRADPTESAVENGLGIFGGVHQDTLVRTVDTTK